MAKKIKYRLITYEAKEVGQPSEDYKYLKELGDRIMKNNPKKICEVVQDTNNYGWEMRLMQVEEDIALLEKERKKCLQYL